MKKTRMTNQRLKILEYLGGVKTHPIAETVYKAVKKDLPSITLATVYRNLNFLAEQGKILRIEVNGICHFDADTSFHQHAVCKKCGKIIDLYRHSKVQETLKKIRIKGFKPESVCVIIYGTCNKCKPRRKQKA